MPEFSSPAELMAYVAARKGKDFVPNVGYGEDRSLEEGDSKIEPQPPSHVPTATQPPAPDFASWVSSKPPPQPPPQPVRETLDLETRVAVVYGMEIKLTETELQAVGRVLLRAAQRQLRERFPRKKRRRVVASESSHP